MKIVSFNVNGLKAILKKDFIQDFDKLDADIFSLNETKLSEISDELYPFKKEGYYLYHRESIVRKGYSGVAIYTKIKPLNVHYGLKNNKYDDEGRVITLEFDNFFYVASYVPNSGENLKRLHFRLEYEDDLKAYLNELNKIKPVIYAGDLNVAHKEIDLKNPKPNVRNAGFTIEERNKFSELLNEGFIDVYRYFNPNEIKYTWWSYRFNARMNNAGWRIDYFVISKSIIDKVVKIDLHNEIFGSDHCPIELVINI